MTSRRRPHVAVRLLPALLVLTLLAATWWLVGSMGSAGSVGSGDRGEPGATSTEFGPLDSARSPRAEPRGELDRAGDASTAVAHPIRVHVLGGSVVDDAGRPVPDARILIGSPDGDRELSTDEHGRFATTLKSGQLVSWSAHKSGHALARAPRHLPRDDWRARIDRLVKARIDVVDAEGLPAQDAYVLLVAADEREAADGEIASFHFRHGPERVPDDGRVTALLPAGRWYALTSWTRDELVDLHRAIDVELAGVATDQVVELVPGRDADFVLRAPPAASVRGWVAAFGKPLPNAGLSLRLVSEAAETANESARREAEARTDAEGRFVVRNLVPGDWQLDVAASVHSEPCWSQSVSVHPRQTVDVAVELPEQGVLVRVLDRRDEGPWRPANGATIRHGRADELTGFRRMFDGPPRDSPGLVAFGDEGQVWVPAAEAGPVRLEAWSPRGFRHAVRDVVVEEGRLTEVELRLEPSRSVRLTPVDYPPGVALSAEFRDEDTGELLHVEPLGRSVFDGEVYALILQMPTRSYAVTVVDEQGRIQGRAELELELTEEESWEHVEELALEF